ncbi:lipase [Oleiphilus messinensis]|uniref:Lipase chaperone n=1 Tax=Oleiphilus messinensis TaxID=141451 RepID=A0A1Y0IE43_9GAMM|nr:lipase secretion chaperone [Oleiphilus messinensis]ARU58439.1 lipase [Oleiphilus messinensis]
MGPIKRWQRWLPLILAPLIIALIISLDGSEKTSQKPMKAQQLDITAHSQLLPPAPRPGHAGLPRANQQHRESETVQQLPALPKSLQGTSVPDGLAVDRNGQLILNRGLRDVFDYYLSTLGEENPELIQRRILAMLNQALPEPALSQSIAALDRYISYLKSLETLQQYGGVTPDQIDPERLQEQQQELKALREQYLGDTLAQAFFQDDESWADYTIARIRILQNTTLNQIDKARELDVLRTGQPEFVQSQLNAVSVYQDLKQLTSELEEQGANQAEVRLLREQMVGVEAADRLEALDQKRAQFQQRINNWLTQRESLLNQSQLDHDARQRAVKEARASQFEAQEMNRVIAFEHRHDQHNRTN